MTLEYYSHFIFDLDGTLIDSADEVLSCLGKAFELSGHRNPISANLNVMKKFIGPPLDKIISSINPSLSPQEIVAIAKEFKTLYDNSDYTKTSVFEGVSPLLETLHSRGIYTYIATNKREFPTRKIIEIKKLGPFRDVVCLDSSKSVSLTKTQMLETVVRKWSLHLPEVIMVGDSRSDLLAAREVGIHSVAVLQGYDESSSLLELKPNFVVNGVVDLLEML